MLTSGARTASAATVNAVEPTRCRQPLFSFIALPSPSARAYGQRTTAALITQRPRSGAAIRATGLAPITPRAPELQQQQRPARCNRKRAYPLIPQNAQAVICRLSPQKTVDCIDETVEMQRPAAENPDAEQNRRPQPQRGELPPGAAAARKAAARSAGRRAESTQPNFPARARRNASSHKRRRYGQELHRNQCVGQQALHNSNVASAQRRRIRLFSGTDVNTITRSDEKTPTRGPAADAGAKSGPGPSGPFQGGLRPLRNRRCRRTR